MTGHGTQLDAARPLRFLTAKDLDRMPQLRRLGPERIAAMKAVARVLPFRVNTYVVDELIRWEDVPRDPMFQLAFPQPGMLPPHALRRLVALLEQSDDGTALASEVHRIRAAMNPHPGGQVDLNVPRLDGRPLAGVQHKYRETVLFFPNAGQTCHSYCTYCFRWPQFVDADVTRFAARETEQLVSYLLAHREVDNVVLTGGDPMVMGAHVLERYLRPLLHGDLEHIRSIRIGTKALAYWPWRFTSDADAGDVLRLFEDVERAGRHLTVMAHYSHPRELETSVAQEALRRVRGTGAVVRCHCPLVRRVNDDAATWTRLLDLEVRHGAVPYYLFVERNTGPNRYFEVPLIRALEVFQRAFRSVSGLGRTLRGPVMSTTAGKVLIDGTARVHEEEVFVLKFLQAREPTWVGRVFFARYDPTATWFDDLRPAFGASTWWFESEDGPRRITLPLAGAAVSGPTADACACGQP